MTATPLLVWLRAATPDQRSRLAAIAGTSVTYLYQLATCTRPRPSAELALAIEDGTRLMADEGLPVVSVRELATMCALQGLE